MINYNNTNKYYYYMIVNFNIVSTLPKLDTVYLSSLK